MVDVVIVGEGEFWAWAAMKLLAIAMLPIVAINAINTKALAAALLIPDLEFNTN